MTLLGKILTVCILVASLFLMFFGMTVYGLHRNWREDYLALNKRLQDAQADASAAVTKYENAAALLKAEYAASQQEVAKLETARLDLTAQLTDIQAQVDELRADRREAVAAVAATEENNKRLSEEVSTLRQTARDAQQARDRAFAQTLESTSELHFVAGALQTARERTEQLLGQLARSVGALREHGIDPEAEVVVRVRGKVSPTRRAEGGQLIEISIGYDDGLRPGQTVEVFRGERFLGRAEVLKADPDRAVARILREYQQGLIQQGDDVATKLAGGR
ncbi:MAG TPA: hypothetical protein PKC18_02395 [Lacipirellulaceae bacterium]|nr:hypothetical protein [Lacipirellulaceae bacterium]